MKRDLSLLRRSAGGSSIPVRFWAEVTLASASACLALATALRRDWIEAVTGVDPDRHSGMLEWLLVVTLLVLSLAVGAAARAEWRRARAQA